MTNSKIKMFGKYLIIILIIIVAIDITSDILFGESPIKRIQQAFGEINHYYLEILRF